MGGAFPRVCHDPPKPHVRAGQPVLKVRNGMRGLPARERPFAPEHSLRCAIVALRHRANYRAIRVPGAGSAPDRRLGGGRHRMRRKGVGPGQWVNDRGSQVRLASYAGETEAAEVEGVRNFGV